MVRTRAQYISAASSEKITLAHVDAKKRLYVFSGPVGLVYTKSLSQFVAGLKQNDQDLTKVDELVDIIEGSFHYNVETGTLSVRFFGDVDPKDTEVIVTHRFFFSDKSLQLNHDLSQPSSDVQYSGRIISGPGYKHKIGIDQALTSLVGEGTLSLKNEDGGLDEVFDTLVFENQEVVIYSWNPGLQPTDARTIYRGRVTNKTYDGVTVKFKIKDQLFALLDAPQINAYSESDNVSESVRGQYKRRIYGRVDGLRCQSTSQVSDGVVLTGTVTMVANSTSLSGVGTSFLQEVLQGDKISVGTQEFSVAQVIDDTSILTDDESEFAFSGQEGLLTPERGSVLRNRTFLAAGHVCAQVSHNITNVLQFNRLTLDSTAGLFAGDFIEFLDTSERIEIKNIAPGNLVVLQQNMVTKPTNGTGIIRQPIQEVYVGSRRVNADDYAIFNTGGECGVVLQDDVEFNLARARNTVFNATFTNGSRSVAIPTTEISLDEVFSPGDWVKPDGLAYTTFYRVSNVNEASLDLDTDFVDITITDIVEVKSPEYIDDETVVSVNILGRTVDGTASGEWIQTAAQSQLDLLKDININVLNDQSFTDGSSDAYQLISMAIPNDFASKSLPNVKDIVDQLNKSVRGSLTLDNDLLIKFKVIEVISGENLREIRDSDVIDWKIKSTNGKTYKTAIGKYRFSDVELSTLSSGNKFLSFDSEFITRYIGTTKTDELELFLYKELDAKIAVRRHLYYNRLGVATLSITTDLRLENVEIGDAVIADFQRLYKRFGDSTFRKKTMLVIGKTITGDRTTLELSDLGNTFNTSAFITPNDAPEYNSATDDQKLIHGYITDNQGITNDEEDTAGVNLIS